MDSGCGSCVQTSPPHTEPCCVGADATPTPQGLALQTNLYGLKKLQPLPLKVGKSLDAGRPVCMP